jgi:hypothetical protein
MVWDPRVKRRTSKGRVLCGKALGLTDGSEGGAPFDWGDAEGHANSI